MTVNQIIILVVVILVLGIIVFPLINRRQFINLEPNQQIRLIMKEAKGLVYFKNVSKGSTGVLFYVKNKRKILALPWVLDGGNMLCTKKNPFSNWDYPEDKQEINQDELAQLKNLKNIIKRTLLKLCLNKKKKDIPNFECLSSFLCIVIQKFILHIRLNISMCKDIAI